jgi:TRAP-type mannitol/chloroaromatic compound transport system substrate-binding protein
MSWKAIDRNSKDYAELKKQGIKFYKTPDAVLQGTAGSLGQDHRHKAKAKPAVQEGDRLAEGLRRPRHPLAERLHG